MSLTSIVRRAAQVNARGPAVIDGTVRTSWSAFADRVSRVAGGLVALGSSKGMSLGALRNLRLGGRGGGPTQKTHPPRYQPRET